MRVVITAGGTGGHIYPALSIINKIKELEPDSEFLYIGTTNRMEKDIVPNLGIDYLGIKMIGLSKNPVKLLEFGKDLRAAIKKCKEAISKFNPDIVIGVGGYVTSPVVLAAHKLNKKIVLHEQNSIPGKANVFLSKYADAVFISMESSRKYFKNVKVVYTGNPRSEYVLEAKRCNKKKYGLDLSKRLVLITTGSLGASLINKRIVDMLPKLENKNYEVLLVTGKSSYDEIKKSTFPSNVKITPYIEDMASVLKVTDLIVSRAGATTISEITALGIPSIIIPSPYVANNHQEINAQDLENNKASIVIRESELTDVLLLENIDKVLKDSELYKALSNNAKAMSNPKSATKIYQEITNIIK